MRKRFVFMARAITPNGEIERTPQTAKEIHAGNWPEAGRLMDASHASLRDEDQRLKNLATASGLPQSRGLLQEVGGCGLNNG